METARPDVFGKSGLVQQWAPSDEFTWEAKQLKDENMSWLVQPCSKPQVLSKEFGGASLG